MAKDIRSSVEATTFKSSHTKTATTVYIHSCISQALRSRRDSPLEPVSYIVLRRNPHYTRIIQTFRTCLALTSVLAAVLLLMIVTYYNYYSYMTSLNLQPTMSDLRLILPSLLPPGIYFKAPGAQGGQLVGLKTVRKVERIRQFTCIERGFCMAQ